LFETLERIRRQSGWRGGSKPNSQIKIYSLKESEELSIGQKGMLIRWLSKHAAQIPNSYVLTEESHQIYKADPERVQHELRTELARILDPECAYAVRSSSNLEDQEGTSFAGQFTSVLNVQGIDALISAVVTVFDSLQSEQVSSYQAKVGSPDKAPTMGVLIQEMVTPVVSGVAVSRNPLTGLNEIMIEAVEGTGESLVQEGATPNHWVYKWGRFIQHPERPILGMDIVEGIARETTQLAEAFGSPVDLEWVYDGEKVYWVQIRPLTGVDHLSIYSNRISREFLPGLIKPLIWSVNIPLVNGAWIRLFEQLVGPTGLKPEALARSFYYHAYFNMGAVGQIFQILGFPRDSLELLMGFEKSEHMPGYRPTTQTLRFVPRVFRFLLSLRTYPKRLDRELQEIRQTYDQFRGMDFDSIDAESLMDVYEQLFAVNERMAYHNILVPLIMSVFNGMLKRQLVRVGIDPLAFDWSSEIEDILDYDPLIRLNEISELIRALPQDLQRQLPELTYADLPHEPQFNELSSAIESFLDTFGHFGESGNDFSIAPWRENPDLVLEMIRQHTKQSQSEKIGWNDLHLKPVAAFMVRIFGARTRAYILERERVSSMYTLGYGLFRVIFLALGQRFVDKGLIDEEEGIFYLSLEEIRSLVNGEGSSQSAKNLIQERRDEMRVAKDLILPEIIYGDEAPPLETFTAPPSNYHGMPTSRGYYQGKVTVIESLSEMEKLQDGDVLVIPYSDVAWTPLFARAGAVIAQSGGVLSHSSIVAREMGIPCVVSVPNACQMQDGTLVIVDGHRGEIAILEEAE
jgi:pyruvate,water dikinase